MFLPGSSLLNRLLAPHRPALALVLLSAVLYLPSVWSRDLWSPDEPRYAEVTRQMQSRDDYILPHLNGAVYGEKPPLFFWLGLAAGKLPGIPEPSGTRLVSVFAALGTLLLTWRLGRKLMDTEAAWLAALVLATSSMFVLHATSGVIDGFLTLIITAAISVGLRAHEEQSPVLWAGFYAIAGLGLITKGPVALVVPGGTLLILSVIESGPRGVLARHPLWGVPLAAGVAALWLVPAIARGGESYAEIILLKQNVGRAYNSWHHKQPITYFLRVFPVSFVPWILALPLALISAWRARRDDPRSRPILLWFLFTFLFFSVVSGKKTRYLLPLFPAASLLVGHDLAHHAAKTGRRVVVAILLAIQAAAGALLAAVAFLGPVRILDHINGMTDPQRQELAWMGHLPGTLAVAVPGLLVLCVALAGLALLRREPRRALGAALLASLAGIAWIQWVAVPAINVIKSPVPLAAAARRAAGEGPDAAPIVLYRDAHSNIFNYYIGRDSIPKMVGAERTSAWLRGHPGSVVISIERDLRVLEGTVPGLARVACRRMGDDVVCVARAGQAEAPR